MKKSITKFSYNSCSKCCLCFLSRTPTASSISSIWKTKSPME